MCEHCSPSIYATQTRVDPTRTLSIQNAMVREVHKRYASLSKAIKTAIVDNDVFGARLQTNAVPLPNAFAFLRGSDKVQAFMSWLKQQSQDDIIKLGVGPQLGVGADQAWTNLYIEDTYKRGVQRARVELKKGGAVLPSVEESGGLQAILSTPLHADRLGLLFTRTYEELSGINAQMDSQISRVLTQGMADGDGPRLLARKLLAVVNGTGAGELGLTDTLGRFIPAKRRAEILARTEIVRAHHLATIQEYRNWGAAGVTVQAEWVTAGDSRVCSVCASLQGNVYTLDEIEGMIPAHPQCRCIAIPTLPTDTATQTEEQPTPTSFTDYDEAVTATANHFEGNEEAITVISDYSHNAYGQINAHLRGTWETTNQGLIEKRTEQAKLLEEVLKGAPKFIGESHRGVSFTHTQAYEEYAANLKKRKHVY